MEDSKRMHPREKMNSLTPLSEDNRRATRRNTTEGIMNSEPRPRRSQSEIRGGGRRDKSNSEITRRNPSRTSSLAGILPTPGVGPYCASKHAIEGFTKCVREELRPWSIHVSNINPGFMRTPILARGVTASQKTFNEAPVEITSEYTQDFITEFNKMMNDTADVTFKFLLLSLLLLFVIDCL